MVQAFFRARGRAGYCSTCTGTGGDETQGPSATVYGTISDKGTSPPTLTVTMIRPPSEPCNASLATAYIKPAVRNRARPRLAASVAQAQSCISHAAYIQLTTPQAPL